MRAAWIVAAFLAASLHGAPPAILYSNDATNLISCPPPGFEHGSVPERLRATIAEASGAEVQLLQPGNGWVPWWRSEQYPANVHYRWFEATAAREPDMIGQFIRDGGDLVAEFIRASRSRGVSPYVSLRLNDYHGSESWDILRAFAAGDQRNAKVAVGLGAMAAQSRVLLDRTDLQLKPDPPDYVAKLSWSEKIAYAANAATRIKLRTARVWNWACPEVPAYKLGFIRELCANYDFDGLELDFMRWSSFFRLEETNADQRRAVMLAFIQEVRRALDQGSRGERRRRQLGVRVPSRLSGHAPLGIDLPAWVEMGVDWVNLSCHYISEQQTDLATITRTIPRTPVYLELTFASAGRVSERHALLDGTEEQAGYRLLTKAQLITAVHLAYARGAAGVSLFNFAYYRNLGPAPASPPFDRLAKLKDREWVAQQPQHYFLSMASNPPSEPSAFARNRRLAVGKASVFRLDLCRSRNGWIQPGRLRLELTEPWGERRATVRFNDRVLEPASDTSEPYADALAPRMDGAFLRAWSVPSEALRDGDNAVEVSLETGNGAEIRFLDLAVP